MTKTYKIRRFTNGKNKKGEPYINYSVTIPSHIAENLPSDMAFACELTEVGIVFSPATENEKLELPSWALEGPGGDNGALADTQAVE